MSNGFASPLVGTGPSATMPEPSPSQLRYALAQRLGMVLTPEVAAAIEAVATANPLPVPVLPAGSSLDVSQAPEHYAFLAHGMFNIYEPKASRVIADVGQGGSIKAVVLITQPGRYSAEISVASDGSTRWLSRQLLRASFGYVFDQLGMLRVDSRVHSANTKAIRMNEKLGFKHEGIRRRSFGNADGILMGMLRSECRWIGD
jgi:RimJ/RimL family protein N-acetyltransferase